uniref:Uncharacterized protein n=1 Tax=Macrostomum lignano TaxID=282301 RepID=A0A1I8JNY9_9PLAT
MEEPKTHFAAWQLKSFEKQEGTGHEHTRHSAVREQHSSAPCWQRHCCTPPPGLIRFLWADIADKANTLRYKLDDADLQSPTPPGCRSGTCSKKIRLAPWVINVGPENCRFTRCLHPLADSDAFYRPSYSRGRTLAQRLSATYRPTNRELCIPGAWLQAGGLLSEATAIRRKAECKAGFRAEIQLRTRTKVCRTDELVVAAVLGEDGSRSGWTASAKSSAVELPAGDAELAALGGGMAAEDWILAFWDGTKTEVPTCCTRSSRAAPRAAAGPAASC